MTLEELKKLKLPVKLVCKGGWHEGNLAEITLTAFNSLKSLIIDNKDGRDSYLDLDAILNHYKVAPNTKIIERECWLNIYDNTITTQNSKELAEYEYLVVHKKPFCKHIKIKFEVDADTGELIREVE